MNRIPTRPRAAGLRDTGDRGSDERRLEEVRDDLAQRVERRRAVQRRSQMRSVFESFRVVRAEGPQLVDDPAIVALLPVGGLAHTLVQEQGDVVEQEKATLLHPPPPPPSPT